MIFYNYLHKLYVSIKSIPDLNYNFDPFEHIVSHYNCFFLTKLINLFHQFSKKIKKKVACLEEIALKNKWISKKHINASIKFYGNCDYSKYLKKLI